jgi:hypothetical protein
VSGSALSRPAPDIGGDVKHSDRFYTPAIMMLELSFGGRGVIDQIQWDGVRSVSEDNGD